MTLHVLVKLKRNEGLSWDGQKLIANIKASPAKGAANKRIEFVIAGWLKIPVDCVTVQKGETSRNKVVVADIDQELYRQELLRVPEPPKQLRIPKQH